MQLALRVNLPLLMFLHFFRHEQFFIFPFPVRIFNGEKDDSVILNLLIVQSGSIFQLPLH